MLLSCFNLYKNINIRKNKNPYIMLCFPVAYAPEKELYFAVAKYS